MLQLVEKQLLYRHEENIRCDNEFIAVIWSITYVQLLHIQTVQFCMVNFYIVKIMILSFSNWYYL